jgi:hypothetical protein
MPQLRGNEPILGLNMDWRYCSTEGISIACMAWSLEITLE